MKKRQEGEQKKGAQKRKGIEHNVGKSKEELQASRNKTKR